ncbi:NAD(P)-binding protein [Lentinus brumalis]|uniref:NAD(P)-binding protein n=1 Tax=Lentinus brumalis TaxID=2498619 RepID=A0A371D3J4_9APHY|nr:NAD(P)-binding protein [Polyporus brumalis]
MSLFIQWVQQAFPPAPTWHPADMPDLSGKVVLVTGGNAGIGREIVKELLRKNARVYLAARSPVKAREAIKLLKAETGKTAEFLQLDLSDLDAVRVAAQEFKRRESHIDVLYLNAGLMLPPIDELTAQSYDLTFGTNVIGHFLFLQLLYPLLDSVSHRPNSSDPARVVWVSGFANYLVPGGKLSYSTFTDGPARRNVKRGMFAMYAQSKLAQITLSTYLAKRAAEAGQNVVSFAVDPGNIQSEIFRGDKVWYLRLWERFIMYPTAYGAITPLYAGTAPEALEHNGKYLRPWARRGDPNPVALDIREQEKLWAWLEAQVKAYLTL